jgi:hypothetical protein
MFVKADNRSFQQELAQEASSDENNNQNQEVQLQDQSTIGVTAANLSQIPSLMRSEARGKRKHSVGSSVATNGSTRSDLADVFLEFDDTEAFPGDNIPQAVQQGISHRSSRFGDVTDSLAKSETHQLEATAQGDERETTHPEGNAQGGSDDSNTNVASTSKMPEMTERRGGLNPFLARPGNSAQNPIDLMDLDTEPEIMDG